ncbi:MAG TPA: oligosaccharide flippase family protein [Candidatus Dormibacteraeota bacterium]
MGPTTAIAGSRRWAAWSALRSDRYLRNNAIYLTGSVVAGAFGYVFHFVSGRLLGPAGYGVVAAAIAAIYLLTLPSLIVQLVSARFASLALAQRSPAQVGPLVRGLTLASLVFGSCVALVMIALAPVAARALQLGDVRVVYVLAPSTLLGLVVSVNRGVMQGLLRFGGLSVNVVVDTFSRVPAAATLILGGLGPLGGVAGVIAGPLLAYGHSLALLRGARSAGGGTQGAAAATGEQTDLRMAEVARYAAPTAVAVIGVTFLFNADVVLAKHFLSAEQAGVYAAGSVLARVVYFLGITIATVMFPEVAARHARDRKHYHVVDRSLAFLALIGIALTVVYTALPGLVLLPYGSGFASVQPYLGPFAVALSLLAVANLLVNYFLSVNSPRFVIPLLGACLLEVGLILLFHGSVAQVLIMLLATTGALAGTLLVLYRLERRGREL